jgi:hypothetical protein
VLKFKRKFRCQRVKGPTYLINNAKNCTTKNMLNTSTDNSIQHRVNGTNADITNKANIFASNKPSPSQET